MEHAERQLGGLDIVSPVDGVVAIMPNWRACCPPPDFKSGDRAWPGQVDRRSAGSVDAAGDRPARRSRTRTHAAGPARGRSRRRGARQGAGRARSSDISALARVDFSNWPPQRNFDLIVQLDEMDPRLRPGMNTTVRVAVDRVADVVLIPARAVFEKEGRSVAYVRDANGGWDERLVQIARRGQEQLVVREGVGPGERVALKDPIPRDKDTMTEANRKRLGWSLAGCWAWRCSSPPLPSRRCRASRATATVIPTARVAEGDVPVVVHASGELKPMRAQALVAPSVGGPMQILSIEATGTPVKEGDVVVEFDKSEQEERLVTAKSELAQAEQEIVKMRADAVVQRAQDEVALLTARFDVRRAELDVQGSLLSSAIDKQKFVLTLEETKARLAQLQNDLQSRADTDRASLAVLEEKRNKARLQMDNAQKNIDNMTLRAPFDGLVAAKDNDMNNAAWAGVVVPEFRAGDTVYPGRQVAEVLHQSGIELIAKVSEYDRAHLNAGQNAEVTIHAVQGKSLPATIKSVAGASRRDVWSWNDPTRTFDVSFDVKGSDPARLRPGLTTQVLVTGAPIKAAKYLPRQALFEQDGKPVVFVRQGRSFEPREVQVLGSDRNACRGRRSAGRHGSGAAQSRSLTRRRAQEAPVRCSHEPARDTRVSSRPEVAARHRPSGSAARPRQPPRPQAALAADDARHDLRRRGRRRDAVDRRGRAAAGDGVHRAVGCAQRHRRGARDDRASGVRQGAELVARPHLSGLPGHPRDDGGRERGVAAQALSAVQDVAEAAAQHADGLRRHSVVYPDRKLAARSRTFLR